MLTKIANAYRIMPTPLRRLLHAQMGWLSGVGAADAAKDAQRTASVVSKMFPDDGRHHKMAVNREVAAKKQKLSNESGNRAAKSAKGGAGDKKGGGKGGGSGKGGKATGAGAKGKKWRK